MWSFPPSRILVPVDFGEASGRAVALASALASRVHGRLHLLHAEMLEAPAYFTHEQVRALEHERQVARARAREFLGDFARTHGASQFTSHIEEGLPTSVIVDSAAQADLVVMGTHGRKGPARWWIGSVAERVIHQSPVPVLVVRADGEHVPAETVFERPMVMASPSSDDESARGVATGLASAFGGHVADGAATCPTDLTRGHGATLVVVPSAARHGALHAHPAEHWLRSCPLPMLFIPGPVSNVAGPESSNRP